MAMRADKDSQIDRALKHFDALPTTATVSFQVACLLLGISESTYRRQEGAGLMPRRRALSPNRSGVVVGELREALAVR